MDSESFGFTVEWFDAQADLMREYSLTVFKMAKGPLEAAMYDPKSKRAFLKRMAIPDLRLEDLHVGSTVTIYARHLKVKSYADSHTSNYLDSSRTELALLVQPHSFNKLGQVMSCFEAAGLTMSRVRLVNHNGPVVAIQAVGDDAQSKLDYGCCSVQQCVKQVSIEELAPYFEDQARYPCTAAFDHCTMFFIRPHALKAGTAGEIISTVMEAGFEISAMQMLHLQRAEAAELLDVYKGVVPYHKEMVDGTCIAPLLAMELRGDGSVVERLRQLCGPHDVDMARHLRPESLRARFGADNANNGVHSTDLEDDAELEVRYVFEMLAA